MLLNKFQTVGGRDSIHDFSPRFSPFRVSGVLIEQVLFCSLLALSVSHRRRDLTLRISESGCGSRGWESVPFHNHNVNKCCLLPMICILYFLLLPFCLFFESFCDQPTTDGYIYATPPNRCINHRLGGYCCYDSGHRTSSWIIVVGFKKPRSPATLVITCEIFTLKGGGRPKPYQRVFACQETGFQFSEDGMALTPKIYHSRAQASAICRCGFGKEPKIPT